MSEPRHIWLDIDEGDIPRSAVWATRKYQHESRYTLTEGEEWNALMERAREVLATPVHKEALAKGELLRDILTYLGEKP